MSAKVLVIGAGIVGVSTALALARRGFRVRVIEKNPAVGCGSTAQTSSVIRCHYTRKEAIALAHEGACVWGRWSEYLGLQQTRANYHATGVLFLMRQGAGGPPSESLGVKAEMDQSDLDARLAMMKEIGVEASLMNPEALSEHLPFFSFPEDDVVGIWEPQSGFVYPPVGAVEDLHEAAVNAGVTFSLNTSVVDGTSEWRAHRRQISKVNLVQDGLEECVAVDAVVNCAGPASHEINLAFNCPLPLSTAPQRQFIVEATWSNPIPGVPAMADLSTGFYIRPHHEVFKVGAALALDHVDFSIDTTHPKTEQLKTEFQSRVLASLNHRIPHIELTDIETKVAFYDWSVSDSYPIIDATDIEGYYVAIGTSGAWFKGGPVIGEMMAEKIHRDTLKNKKQVFKLAYTSNEIPLNAFAVHKRIH